MPSAMVIGRATEPVLPSVSNVAKSIAGSSASDSSISLRCAVPTWWQKVLSMSSRDQPVSSRKSANVAAPAAMPSCISRSASVCISGLHAAGHGFVAAAVAQFVAGRCALGPWPPAADCRCGSSSRSVSSTAALPEPIVSEATASFDVFARQRRVGVERCDRGFDQRPAAFGAHDQAGADLAQLDHVGHLHHAVENAQAGVRDVVDQAVWRAGRAVVHAAGRGRLEIVAADRAVDQGADLRAVDAGRRDGPLGAFRRFSRWAACPAARSAARECRSSVPAGPRAAAAAVERLEAGFELVGGDDLVGQRVGERFEADVLDICIGVHSR